MGILESGFIVALGLVIWFLKLSWRGRMRLLTRPMLVDAIVFISLTFLHWGTYSGVMAATIGALVCSTLLGIGRKLFGYYEGKQYIPGAFDISHRLEN